MSVLQLALRIPEPVEWTMLGFLCLLTCQAQQGPTPVPQPPAEADRSSKRVFLRARATTPLSRPGLEGLVNVREGR